MKIGALVNLTKNTDIDFKFSSLVDMGIDNCQLCCWNTQLYTADNADRIINASKKYSVSVTALWCGWSGPQVWDFYEGPKTLGIVPQKWRKQRSEEIKRGSDFAKSIGVTDIVTHAGFMPENPDTDEYREVVETLCDIAEYAQSNNQYFLFETGQETPVTLLRTIEDIGTLNLGINLDPANLVMYGKANPVDALNMFGKLVRGVHAKDGFYPVDAKCLGREARLGDGVVDYSALIKLLSQFGYNGAITIEREITGSEQIADIKHAKAYLDALIDKVCN